MTSSRAAERRRTRATRASAVSAAQTGKQEGEPKPVAQGTRDVPRTDRHAVAGLGYRHSRKSPGTLVVGHGKAGERDALNRAHAGQSRPGRATKPSPPRIEDRAP